MNAEETTRKILGALGQVNRILRDHSAGMERRDDVKSTMTRLEVVNYQTGPMVEGFIEAEMGNGTALCWNFDLTWTDDAFRIEATLDRSSSKGSETLKRLPTKVLHHAEQLPDALTDVTRALLALNST